MYDVKIDRGFKIRAVIDHLNKKFAEVLSNDKAQSNDNIIEVQRAFWYEPYIKS